MEFAATLAFAALMLAHMTAYFAIRRFHTDDGSHPYGDIEIGRHGPESEVASAGPVSVPTMR
jgi:hypothetical protein